MAILIACEYCRKTYSDPTYRWIQVNLPVDGVNIDSMRSMMSAAMSSKNWHYEELLFCTPECTEMFFMMRRVSETLEA